MVMHGKPELRTTRECWNAGHKGRESIIRVKEDILCGPWIVATDKARCLGGNIRCLQQPSAASSVRVGKARWGRRYGSTW